MRTKICILLWWPSWYLLFFMHGTEVIATSGVEGGPDLQAVTSTCKKTINGCPNQNAEKKCKKCCRNAGCKRGDCKKNILTNQKWKCVCNCKLQWVVREKISSYGQNLTLFCSVDNCCNEDAGWTEEGMTIFLDFKTYSNLKYGSTYNESGFGLVIRNLSETDLNKTYECTYGFQTSTHQYLQQEDVFRKDDPSTDKENSTTDGPSTDKENSTTDGPSTDKENSTTDGPSTDKENSTTDEGNNTMIIVAIIVPLIALIGISLIIYLIIVYIVKRLIFCLCRRQQYFSGKKQSNTNYSVHYSAEQQEGLLSPTSENRPTEETNDDLIRRQEQGGNHPDPRPDNEPSPTWCICTHCREMPTEKEKLCCNQGPQKCYSRDEDFDRIVEVNKIYRPGTGNIDSSEMRKESYEKLCVWLDWPLEAGNRRPLPSCCVWKIRDKYPNTYCGHVHNI